MVMDIRASDRLVAVLVIAVVVVMLVCSAGLVVVESFDVGSKGVDTIVAPMSYRI